MTETSCEATQQPRVTSATAMLVAATLTLFAVPALADEGDGRLRNLFDRAHDAIAGQVADVKERAMATYLDTPRAGSCAERRDRFRALLPEALRFSRYARDIYTMGHDDEMAARGALSLDVEPGRTAYRDPTGKRYAEVRTDPARKEAVVVFRGTRVTVGSDIYTDVGSHFGLETGYYKWAAELVGQAVRAHPGMAVIVTGQSLGGGLTIYAVLRNPGVTGFAFNPAGLSKLAWFEAGPAERARVNRALTVVSTRNDAQIEPITALSFAGRSVIPGHIFVVETDVVNERTLHGPETIVSALEQLQASGVAGTACDGDLGVIAH